MQWDTWALLTIAVLCGSVILWSWWGFHNDAPAPDPTVLRLSVNGGGHLDVPRSEADPGRHRQAPRTMRTHPRHLRRTPQRFAA